jgi:hypothetical protein
VLFFNISKGINTFFSNKKVQLFQRISIIFQNVRKVDTFFSDDDDSDTSDIVKKVKVKHHKKATKEKVKLLPRYTDSPDGFEASLNESKL